MYVLNKYKQINNNITKYLSKYNTISIRYNVYRPYYNGQRYIIVVVSYRYLPEYYRFCFISHMQPSNLFSLVFTLPTYLYFT